MRDQGVAGISQPPQITPGAEANTSVHRGLEPSAVDRSDDPSVLDWRAVAFVASDKGGLHRVLREKGAVIDSEGHAALRGLPETFREWISMPPARRFKAGHSAISGVVVGGRTAPAPERSRDLAKNAA